MPAKDRLEAYWVLDKHGKARPPKKMREDVVASKDDRVNIRSKQPSNAAPDRDHQVDQHFREFGQSKQPSNAAPDMTGNPIIPRIGEAFTEKQLYERFKVKNSGGIRPSIKNKVVILISSPSDQSWGRKYNDRVDVKNGVVEYDGEGDGDQEMARGNKSIIRYARDGDFKLLYFEKREPNRLVYRYTLEYVSHYMDTRPNSEGQNRRAIVFKLRIV